MKKILLTSLCLISFWVIANAQKKTFMRIYNINGVKIEKGFLKTTTDSSIVMYKNSGTTETPVSQIGYIKTRRSLWHNILIGSVIGGSGLGIYGAATGEAKINDGTLGGVFHDAFTFTPGEALTFGLIGGAIGGGAVGALTGVFKKRAVFTINGDANIWGKQRAVLTIMQVEN